MLCAALLVVLLDACSALLVAAALSARLGRLSSIKQHRMLLAVAKKEELARGFYLRLKQYEKPEEASLIQRSLNKFDWKRIDAISNVDRDSARAMYIDICVTSFDVKQDTL